MDLDSLTTVEKRVLAESCETDTKILRVLAKDGNSYVRRSALEGLQAKRHLQKLPKDWQRLNEADCIARLNSQHADHEVLEVLAISKSWRIRQAVACNEYTPASILKMLSYDRDSEVRQTALDRQLPVDWRDLSDSQLIRRLSSEIAPSEVVEILSHSDNWVVRQHSANNPGATRVLLERLEKDSDSDVASAARDALLRLLLPDEWRNIKDAKLMRRLKDQRVSAEVLEVLGSSSNWLIRQAVARHDGISPSLLEKLAKDNDSSVREAATIDRQLPPEWRYLSIGDRTKRLSKENAAPEILEVLACSGDWRVRQAVANNAGALVALLKELANDTDSDVATTARDALLHQRLPNEWRTLDESQKIDRVNNGEAEEDILEILSLSTSHKIRRAVASSSTISADSLRVLIKDEDEKTRQNAKESLMRKLLPKGWESLDERETIHRLRRESVSKEALQALAMSEARCIRNAVASNSSVTIPILLAMRKDPSTPARIQSHIRSTWAIPSETSREEGMQ